MIQAKEKFVPTPSSPRRNPFCDGNGKQFDLFFAESINGFILSHFPISSNYQSYEEYEFDVDVWYTSLVNTLKNNIYQNNLSLFLRRPPINYTEYYGKNQFRIGPLHFKQIEETILLGLPYDKNSIFDEKINKNEVPISQWIIPNCPWNSWSIPQFPDPNFYDNFEDFSKAAKNWYEISSQLIRCKARDFKEIKESTESLPIRTWTDVTNETSKELENFIWHPSSFPYQQYVEKQPIKKPALPPLPPPSPQFTFYYIDNRPINESMISSQINRLLGAYKKGFTLDFEVRVHPLIVEFTNYGCDAFDSTTTIDEKELPPAKLTIFELYQILNLDYDQISYYEKNQVYVTILEILNISRPFSLSSMFLTTYSLYVICRIFIEHLEKPFEIIDPCFGCLRDPTFYPYHTQLFNLYFTRILFKVFVQIKEKKAAKIMRQRYIDFRRETISYFEKNPFVFEFKSNILRTTNSGDEFTHRMNERKYNVMKISSYNEFNSPPHRKTMVASSSFYNADAHLFGFWPNSEESFDIITPNNSPSLQNQMYANVFDDSLVGTLVSLYLVSFNLGMNDLICGNCFMFISFILENSRPWFNYFTSKVIRNKEMMLMFMNEYFDHYNTISLSLPAIVNFMVLIFKIKPLYVRKLPNNNRWIFTIISKSTQHLKTSFRGTRLIECVLEFTCRYNRVKSDNLKLQLDCTQIHAMLAALIPYEKNVEVLASELRSFALLLSEPNSIEIFKNTEITKQILYNLKNRNNRVRKAAWKIIRNLIVYNLPKLDKIFRLQSIRRSLESAFHNGALATVEILKLLSSLIRKLTKDDKFISQQYASNFSAIIKFLKECGLSESKILFTFDVKHGTAESNARRKHAVEQFRRLIEANPTIAKAFEEMSTEFGALSPSKKGQSKRKEFSVRRKKQSNN